MFVAAGAAGRHDEWRLRMAAIAAGEGAEFFDFSGDAGVARSAFDGHSGYFFDSLHFMPNVYDTILDRIGLPLRVSIRDLPKLPERRCRRG